MYRWRRRWQWGAGPSHPHATTSDSDATAPVDIEQPAVLSQGITDHDGAGASSSNSHSVLDTTQNVVGLGTTPVNFPGMHYSRSTASRLSAVVCMKSLLVTLGIAACVHQSLAMRVVAFYCYTMAPCTTSRFVFFVCIASRCK